MQEKWIRMDLPYSLIKEGIVEWLKESCAMKYHIKPKDFKNFVVYSHPFLSIKFESSIDAMGFKLRWI